MAIHDFSEIYDQYPGLIEAMPAEFSSHAFILRLAKSNQRAYIDALSAYRDSDAPFLAVHGQLARQLERFPALLQSLGQRPSTDIFGNSNRCEYWRRLA